MNTVEPLQEAGSTGERVNIGDKGAILLMLYNAAIELLEEAKSAIEQGDIAEKGVHISQSHAIISELLASLDFDVGGELARNMEGLYRFILDQLFTANMNNDPKPLEVAISLLTTLQEGWEGAVEAVRRGQA